MSKYSNHQEFGANAPINWRERTTRASYLKGMAGIAPPGMQPKEHRGQAYEARTTQPESTKWHHNYDLAMFTNTDIPLPESESKQMGLESLIRQGSIKRIPQVRR